MIIKFHKNFSRHYEKLQRKTQTKVDNTLKIFQGNPFSPSLKNHVLQGDMHGLRAFSVTGDMRIIFKEYDKYIVVILLDIGTHNRVY